MPKNMFKETTVADQFNQYNDVLEQTLGYRYVLNQLNGVHSVLDYGCGPGKVSMRLAQAGVPAITAVDESQHMVKIAKAKRANKAIDYHVIQNNQLPWLADNSIDAAIACYVFINNGSEADIRSIMQTVYRVLKPGGKFIILDTNPNQTGTPFSTFQNGQTDYQYGYGEARQEWLHVNDTEDLILNDWNWPNQMYEDNLAKAGFQSVQVAYHTLMDLSPAERKQLPDHKWGPEEDHAPFILYTATKAD